MKAITQLDQINMLVKHATRNNIVIGGFRTYITSGNIVYAEVAKGHFTIFTFIEDADSLFKLV